MTSSSPKKRGLDLNNLGLDPEVFTKQRLTTLLSSLLVALCSGTNYAYSAYAPQLGTQLQISHTRLNVIGLAGNMGVYCSGPFLGKIVDQHGPKPLLAGAFVCLLVGYSGIHYFYDAAGSSTVAGGGPRITTFQFYLLVFCSFLTGSGGNGGLSSSMNTTAKSFPDRMRASAAGIVISGFGLSALFFTAIAHIFFPGDTSRLLLVLAFGTSLPMIYGYFFVKAIPLPGPEALQSSRRATQMHIPQDGYARLSGVDGILGGDTIVYDRVNDSNTALLSSQPEEEQSFLQYDDAMNREADLLPPPSNRVRSNSRPSHGRSTSRVIEIMEDKHGRALLATSDFWLLAVILALLSGTGLMYINNIGTISQALFAKGHADYDEGEALKAQSAQVSTISFANFLGRILLGFGADTVKNRFQSPRSYCIVIVSILFILSQMIATHIENPKDLWLASACLGVAYGGIFGLFPTIVIEWFGLTHYSENWGFVSLAPMFGGNVFSIAFGRNFDRHAAPEDDHGLPSLHTRGGLPTTHQCFEGRQCYITSLYMTTFVCCVALGLSVLAAWRDRQRMVITNKARSEVLWDAEQS